MSSSARDAENRGPQALTIVICVSVVSTLFTAARLYTRGRIMGKIRLDDSLIVASVVCGWMNVATLAVAVSHGYGRHSDTLSPEQKSKAILWSLAGYPPGLLSFGLPKPAVVVLLTRILNPGKWHKRFLWAVAVVCVANLFGFMAIIFGQCQPVRAQWDSSVTGTCWSKWVLVSYATYSGVFCVFADVYLSIYPAVVLSRLQMDIRKKVALSIALGFGSISSIIVVYKCTRMYKMASPDSTYEAVELVIWTIRRYTHHNSRSGLSERARAGMRPRTKGHQKEGYETDSFNSVAKTTIVGRSSQESILEQRDDEGKIVRTDAFTVTVECNKA